MKKHLVAISLFVTILGQSCQKEIITLDDEAITTGQLKSSVAPFTNPVGAGADPFVVKAGGQFWSCGSNGSGIYIHDGTTVLTDAISNGDHLVYTPPPGTMYSKNLWAPELHYLSGRWYIYFCANDGNNDNHRMHVLEGGSDANNPLNGNYYYKAKLTATGNDNWGIDGHPFYFGSQLYYVWSGWPGPTNTTQYIYIARMSNPYTLSSARVEISRPDFNWERQGYPTVNEGPHALVRGNTVNIIYSASGSWLDEYCMGRLTCTNGNLMSKSSWTKTGPVLSKTGDVFGPGHASFVKSIDNKQDWMVFHSARYSGSGWDRIIRMQQFTWHGDVPYFGAPVANGVLMARASNGGMPLANGEYKITAKCSNKCLDVPGASTENWKIIQQYTDNNSDAQRWILTDMGDGYYRIISKCSNKSLDNYMGYLNTGNSVIQYEDNGSNSQRWRIENMGNGYYRVVNKHNLLTLDIDGGSTADGAKLQQWYLHNEDAAMFKFERTN